MNRVLALLLVCLTAVPAVAEISPTLKEWGAGPAQWIMTPEEQREWRKVATDSDAVKFIDLFWARRDPSSGTARNEFRIEFDSRVAYSDKTFGEKRKRGAMTDRGRVYISMGAPTTMEGMIGQSQSQMGSSDASSDASGFGQVGTRYTWVWERGDARKFDLSRIEVVFVEDPVTHRVQRDPRRPDFGRAGPVAIRKAIVNPELTAVPAWAATGGLEPVAPAIVAQPTEVVQPAPAEPTPAEPAPDEGPIVGSNTPGVSRLTLLQGGSTFNAQYCSAKAELPKLKFMLLITGPLDGKSTEQRTREKEVKPVRIPAQPGCYTVQGSVPVSKLTAGRYKLTVMIDDVVTGDTYSVKQEFRVE